MKAVSKLKRLFYDCYFEFVRKFTNLTFSKFEYL